VTKWGAAVINSGENRNLSSAQKTGAAVLLLFLIALTVTFSLEAILGDIIKINSPHAELIKVAMWVGPIFAAQVGASILIRRYMKAKN